MSATSGGGGSVSEGSEAGSSSQSTMSVSDSPSTSFQTNLTENVTKITLSEENSARGFESDLNGSKINLSVDERQQRDGIVNVAFDFEEGTNLGGNGGDFKLINGSEKKDKVPEAVNLELVNMVPYSNGNGTSYGVPVNGIPTKKDSEQVDISTPYDEYFVPVNEHKKYMRGEKLYVTKDKRQPTSWRRCLSWVVACTVISVVLILAILAGTGVILSQEPNLVKEASVGRNFAGPNLKPSVTNKSSPPRAEMYMYVPRTIESELVIDNLDFDPALKDVNSSAYKEFTATMEDHLKVFLFDKESSEFVASDTGLKVVNISRDPFKINYRIGWNSKQGVYNPPEPIKMEDVRKRLIESLAKNQDYIDKYHIDRKAIKVNHVINICQMDNGGCSHICYYNYITQQFTCTCPTHLLLDQNGKNCVAWTDSSEDDIAPLFNHTDQPGMPYESTENPTQEHEFNAHYGHVNHQENHYKFENHNGNNFESSTEPGFKGHEGHYSVAEPVPEPNFEPNPEHKDNFSVNSEFEHDKKSVHSSLKNNDHPASEPTAEPNTDGPDHTIYESKSFEHIGDSNSKNQYHVSQSVYKNHEPSGEPIPEPTANSDSRDSINGFKDYEPTGDPLKTPDSKNSAESYFENKNHKITAEPLPEPVPEPTAEENSNEKKYDLTGHSGHIIKDHEPAAEPTPEPVPEPTAEENSQEKKYDFTDHSGHIMKEHEPVAEPTAEENSDRKEYDLTGHSGHIMKNHEPAAEPTPEPEPELTGEENSDGKEYDLTGHSGQIMKDHEPAAEPTPEPVPEPTAEENSDEKKYDLTDHSGHIMKDHESAAEPTPEPVPEPTAEENSEEKKYDLTDHSGHIMKDHGPALGSVTYINSNESNYDLANHSSFGLKDHKPTAELTPKPATEPTSKSSSEDKTQDHTGYSAFESKDNEATAESISEPTPELLAEFGTKGENNDSIAISSNSSENHKLSPKLSPEHSSESSAYVHNVRNEYEFKGDETGTETTYESNAKFNHSILHSANKSIENQLNQILNTEKNAEPTEKATSEFPLKKNSSNLLGNEYNETTVHSTISQENINSEPKSSLNNLNRQFLPSQNKIQISESKIDSDNKSGHHVPYLEDILIKKPSPNSENQNGTNFSLNPLDNIKLTPNGEPVIEEILIDKPDKKSVNQTTSDQTGSDPTLSSKFGDITKAYNRNSTVTDYSEKSSTEHGKNSSIQSVLNDHPEIIEYSKVQNSTQEKKIELETKQPNFEKVESSPYSFDSTTKSKDEVIYHSSTLSSSAGRFEDMTINSEGKTVNLSQNDMSLTTTQPHVHHEFYSVPVAVEFFNPFDNQTRLESKSDLDKEKHTSQVNVKEERRSEEDSIKNSGVFDTNEGFLENENHEISDPNGAKISKENVTKVHKATNETAETILLSTQAPKRIEKINESSAKNLNAGKETIETENKSNVENHETEGNETTKTPEEISNNIKDEVPDDEEFNSLLDKEYKNKEIISNEGKDITKYPSKSFKLEKKKLKDYLKGEKTDFDKKAEVTVGPAVPTVGPAVTSEDFILQKHVNGNENIFDLDYSLVNEPTTKHDGEVTVIDPYGIEGIPGVSLKPYGINNHDISVLQTVAPDLRTETVFPNGGQEFETLKPDFRNKLPDNKEGESKLDKDYKFDKDYKYEKQKISKKKDLKKKVGGKDGKNVELEEERKYFTEVSKDDLDTSQEVKNILETTVNPLDKIKVQSETVFKTVPDSMDKVTSVHEPISITIKSDNPETVPISDLNDATVFEMKAERQDNVTEFPDFKLANKQTSSDNLELSEHATNKTINKLQENDEKLKTTTMNEDRHLMIDEPSAKSTFNVSPGTVYDGQLSGTVMSDPEINHAIMNTTFTTKQETSGVPGTVFDGNSHVTTVGTASGIKFGVDDITQGESEANSTFVVYENTHMLPKIISDNGMANSTTAHPTIIIHGQSGNLQDGHNLRFANSTLHNPGNATVMSIFNGTLTHADGHSFTFTNYSTTFSNGSIVRPTIVVRGQSGALQDGHELRFGNATFPVFVPFSGDSAKNPVYKNSDVYKIENGSYPGTVFDGRFNPQDGHYHMFTNTSGTFVYTNASNPPAFIIKGESGDFGNATAYIIRNNTRSAFPEGFTVPHSVIFRNSTVFAVENNEGTDAASTREIAAQPHEVISNETIHYNHQMSPSFVSSGTAYKVNNYFGYISKCAAGQFQCVNGTSKRGSACISLSSKCDSVNDCSDGSDELGCIENGCPGNFQCADNTCLKRNLVCNGILECNDGSDEKNCESWKCEFDEFQCPSGRCIPVVWQCDNKPDCDNHTDEFNCQTTCNNDEYLCPEGWCIPLSYKCNGIKECSNGEDEQLCDCSHEEFKCQTGGCVSMKQVCNGLDDCPDRSDEWDCVKLEPDTNLLKIKSPSGNYEPVCADNWSPHYSDKVCASLGYFSSVLIEKENNSKTTEMSYYVLKNDIPDDFNKKVIFNFKKSDGNCSSGKLVEIACQEFSCGSRSMTDSSSVEARLVGGMSATAGQWPSVALLYNIRNFHSCTANVLTPRWALASYNCLKMGNKNFNEQDWKFFGGSTVFEVEKESAETRKIISIIPHPQVKFNQFLFTNDLALVELDQALQFTNNLGAVCLPEQEMQPRQICVTAGWGINASEDKVIRQQLQYLPVPTMNLTECNSTEHYSGFITDDKICAGYNSAQKSLCYNEEGAPLMCVNDRGEWELQGIMSYHSDCGRGSHPSIFSSITPVADWIRKTIGNSFQRKALIGSNS